jgi:hypothetical protein
MQQIIQRIVDLLKGRGKWFLLLFIVVFGFPIVRGSLISWRVIEPGYTQYCSLKCQ